MKTSELIDAFKALDRELAPQGIYACEKQTLWSKGLYPLIKSKGFNIGYSKPGRILHWHWSHSETTEGALSYLSYSEVKVRKFGNTYHQDPQAKTANNLKEKKLEKALYALTKEYPSSNESFLVILTFGSTETPFRQEFNRLDDTIDLARLNIIMKEAIWQDGQNREIHTRLRIYKHTKREPVDGGQ